jgi:hypothetical protein
LVKADLILRARRGRFRDRIAVRLSRYESENSEAL